MSTHSGILNEAQSKHAKPLVCVIACLVTFCLFSTVICQSFVYAQEAGSATRPGRVPVVTTPSPYAAGGSLSKIKKSTTPATKAEVAPSRVSIRTEQPASNNRPGSAAQSLRTSTAATLSPYAADGPLNRNIPTLAATQPSIKPEAPVPDSIAIPRTISAYGNALNNSIVRPVTNTVRAAATTARNTYRNIEPQVTSTYTRLTSRAAVPIVPLQPKPPLRPTLSMPTTVRVASRVAANTVRAATAAATTTYRNLKPELSPVVERLASLRQPRPQQLRVNSEIPNNSDRFVAAPVGQRDAFRDIRRQARNRTRTPISAGIRPQATPGAVPNPAVRMARQPINRSTLKMNIVSAVNNERLVPVSVSRIKPVKQRVIATGRLQPLSISKMAAYDFKKQTVPTASTLYKQQPSLSSQSVKLASLPNNSSVKAPLSFNKPKMAVHDFEKQTVPTASTLYKQQRSLNPGSIKLASLSNRMPATIRPVSNKLKMAKHNFKKQSLPRVVSLSRPSVTVYKQQPYRRSQLKKPASLSSNALPAINPAFARLARTASISNGLNPGFMRMANLTKQSIAAAKPTSIKFAKNQPSTGIRSYLSKPDWKVIRPAKEPELVRFVHQKHNYRQNLISGLKAKGMDVQKMQALDEWINGYERLSEVSKKATVMAKADKADVTILIDLEQARINLEQRTEDVEEVVEQGDYILEQFIVDMTDIVPDSEAIIAIPTINSIPQEPFLQLPLGLEQPQLSVPFLAVSN